MEKSKPEFAELHSAVTPMLRKQYSDEEMRRFVALEDESDCQSLDQFIGELEKIVADA